VDEVSRERDAAGAYAVVYERLCDAVPGAWFQGLIGGFAAVTGVPLPTLNGVTAFGADCDPGMVAGLLDEVAGTGLPYVLRLHPGADPSLAAVADERGMVALESEVPVMVLETISASELSVAGRFEIAQLAPAEAELHAVAAGEGFEADPAYFRQLITPAVLGLDGVRCYVAWADGRPVSTGLGVQALDGVGIFNVATVPAYRGQGYGLAVTERIVRDAAADGASWAWLHSSRSGERVYRRVGFSIVERLRLWMADGS
jgi:N-acetylglutamate synthase